MKKITSIILTVVLALSVLAFAGCGNGSEGGAAATKAPEADALKIGVILVGDAEEGYTLAHINGIKAAAAKLGIAEKQIIWKEKVEETEDCYTAAKALVSEGCDCVISNSYGHQDYMAQAAEEFSDVAFVSMTGDYAAISKLDNFYNAFTDVFESRFVSGVVAGMKLAELDAAGKLTAKNKDANGNVKIGYVGAFPYAEVVSGYTAFYLGIKSIYEKVVMQVQYTKSWFDIEKEGATADNLMADGCVIIGQHADSTGAPTAVQASLDKGNVAYSVGYNVSMLDVAATAALTSATNNWEVYYETLFNALKNGQPVPQDWSEGYSKDAVAITALGSSCAQGTQEKVDEVIAAIKAGTLHVFDTSKFTVGGKNITENVVDFSFIDFATGSVIYQGDKLDTVKTDANGVSYVDESALRSAPYFGLRIDGITELNS